MDPIKVDFSGKGADKGREIVIPPEKAVLKVILSVVFALIAGGIVYYFMLPPMNFKAIEFYYFIAIVIASFVGFLALLTAVFRHAEYVPFIKKSARIPVVLILVLALVAGVGYVVGCQFFRAKSYSELMTVDVDRKFSEDIAQPDFNTIPKLDEEASRTVAQKAMGDLAELGLESQFKVYAGTAAASNYPQINYQEHPVRLATLQYANIIKWFTNMRNGLPGYIIINTADEDQEFKALDEPIRYSLSDHFGRHVKRVVRFAYPTYIFDAPSFEIDDAGKPYWIVAHIDKTIGMFGGRDVKGIVLVDAVTGECVYHSLDEVKNSEPLRWIDRVFSDTLIVEQYDYYGRYGKGFWNSILGQENCVKTTEGSNYIALDDDVWLYTGVTSLTSDESIVGFVLVNQRTKETRLYRVSGGKESAGMDAAAGLVQEKEYTATFPLLVNIGGEPTYFMSLKDKAQTVQMYALVNVRLYNKIKITGSTISDCLDKYLATLKAEHVTLEADAEDIVVPDENAPAEDGQAPAASVDVTGKVTEIRTAVIDGNTTYYLRIAGSDAYFTVRAADCDEAVILNVGDTIRGTSAGDGAFRTLRDMQIVPAGEPITEAE